MNQQQTEYFNQYLKQLSPEQKSKIGKVSADYFCADELNANICAELIVKGEKRASCSMNYWYEKDLEPRPQIGDLQVVTDWNGKPVCIIQITELEECRFCDVPESFAALEGEGDKTLEWWREAHWQFFSNECRELKIEPTQDMLLLLEKFAVVYR